MNHEYIDLGLPSGLKWAACNIGANAPEEVGEYFAWGEIKPKDEYNEENSLTYPKNIATSKNRLWNISGNPNMTLPQPTGARSGECRQKTRCWN